MTHEDLLDKSNTYMEILTSLPGRSVGSEGNRQATRFFEKTIAPQGWKTVRSEFQAMDWSEGGATLRAGTEKFNVRVSPYSLGCTIAARLVSASSIAELEKTDAKGAVILLHGGIAKEPLMPKNFVFYNPEEHQEIISLLEKSGAQAIVCATGKNAAMAGGVYPFPMIEDGDFNIPSVYMTEEEGAKLLPFTGKQVNLTAIAERKPSTGYNVIAKKGDDPSRRIVITAHIDAKKGTPGALDNATGVTVLLLLAELLKDYDGNAQLEIVALNGEDYYAVPGQMKYLQENQDKFENILLNINIDGAGYKEGPSAFSFFGLPAEMKKITGEIISQHPGITEGIPWPQGDHSLFVQSGRPAIAVTSKWFLDNMGAQQITHTPKDNLHIVDVDKLADVAEAINALVRRLDHDMAKAEKQAREKMVR